MQTVTTPHTCMKAEAPTCAFRWLWQGCLQVDVENSGPAFFALSCCRCVEIIAKEGRSLKELYLVSCKITDHGRTLCYSRITWNSVLCW